MHKLCSITHNSKYTCFYILLTNATRGTKFRNFRPLDDRKLIKNYFERIIFELPTTRCAVGLKQNFQIKNFKTHLRRRECVGEKNRSKIFFTTLQIPGFISDGCQCRIRIKPRLITEPTGKKCLKNMNHSDSLVNYHKTPPCGHI